MLFRSGLVLVIAGLGITQQIMHTRGMVPKAQVGADGYPKVVVDDGTSVATPPDSYVAPYYSNTQVGGVTVRVTQDSKDKKSFSVSLPSGKTMMITSDANPSIITLNGDDLRFILSKATGLNVEYYIVNIDGSMRLLMQETDQIMFLVDTHESVVSHDNTRITYTAISVEHDTCGGPIDAKIPDFGGAVMELRTTSIAAGQTVTVMKDERLIAPNLAMHALKNGVTVVGYTTDNTKVVVARRPTRGCGSFEDREAFLVTLAQNGAVKQIPYLNTLGDDLLGTTDSGISADGKYFYYEEVSKANTGDVVHRYDLATGNDTIIQ